MSATTSYMEGGAVDLAFMSGVTILERLNFTDNL
jgi:hypothetical protein